MVRNAAPGETVAFGVVTTDGRPQEVETQLGQPLAIHGFEIEGENPVDGDVTHLVSQGGSCTRTPTGKCSGAARLGRIEFSLAALNLVLIRRHPTASVSLYPETGRTSNLWTRMESMYLGSGARFPLRHVALPVILPSLALGLTSWVMYRVITEFEVDIDDGASPPGQLIALGILAAGEIIGILLVFARRKSGFIVAIPAEVLRAIVASSVDTSRHGYFYISAMIQHVALLSVVNIVILTYLLIHFDDQSVDADTDRSPLGADVELLVATGNHTGKPEVFLSYSRKQFYFAESLVLRLRANSVPVWFDVHRIQAGDDWEESIDQGLSTCKSLVLVASRDALRSKNVDYEWRTALEDGKPIYIVLFEAIKLPLELRCKAAAIIDMRSRFESKVMILADRLAKPRYHQDKPPTNNLPRQLLRQRSGTFFVETALMMILTASLFFDLLNALTLVAITEDFPEDSEVGFTTHLPGFVFHGLPSKVYAFLGIVGLTLMLTICSAFLLAAIHYRRRFIFATLRVTLLGSSLLYLNTSFLNYSTNHIVASQDTSALYMPANLHSAAWRDLGDMLLGSQVDDQPYPHFVYGSPFLSVGDAGSYLTAASARWRLPTLLILLLATIAFLMAQRSGSLYRWLATGNAPEKLRFRHNEYKGDRKGSRSNLSTTTVNPPQSSHRTERREVQIRWVEENGQCRSQWQFDATQREGEVEQQEVARETAGQSPQWHLLYHPSDSHIAAEIQSALARYIHADGDNSVSERRDVHLVLLTNHTQRVWLEDREREYPDLICVICTNIQLGETLKDLRRHQWFDYRERSSDKLALLAQSIQRSASTREDYSFPVLPESLTKMVLPRSVWHKSRAMRLYAAWLLAITIFGQGRVYHSLIHERWGSLVHIVARLMFWICIPCCLCLFWLAVELVESRTTYRRFKWRMNIVMIGLFVTQIQFLLSFDNQLSILMLGVLTNVLLAIVWLTPNASEIRRWLPANQSSAPSAVGTLAIPLRRQFLFSFMTYLILFAFFYWSGLIFFADTA
ncbi:toll/interleukin-1 receptor domain-containing protein [Frankia sp. CiP3]|uniref:toll/interleukin-1 receptor domain-containing protein n=1 Tax=Frankia sp. CiP3 TaxID=2880971 RepID=UPI001EF419BE|nr:toll/interleukin-1 receptor domain-containing protein [Frankia sp. CiP3]